MDLKDKFLISLGAATALAGVITTIVHMLKLRHDKKVLRLSLLPKPLCPDIRNTYTTSKAEGWPGEYSFTVKVANRNDCDIQIESISWWIKKLSLRWPLESSEFPPINAPHANYPVRLATSEQHITTVSITYSKNAFWPIANLRSFFRSMAICQLRVEVILTTGEHFTFLPVRELRHHLIDLYGRPLLLVEFFHWYIDHRT